MPHPDPTPRAFSGDEMMAIAPTAVARLYSPWGGEPESFDRVGPVAVISINGPLLQRGGYYWDGYESVSQRLSAALGDSSVGAVLLRINSPGGVAAGAFEAVKAMRAAVAQSGKRVFAFADECACSGAYALACVAEQIWLPPSGDVGSVGVIATYLDQSKLLENLGVRAIVTSTGKRKADGHPLLPFSEEEIASLQARVDHLGALFFDLVAEARAMPARSVQALEAGVFSGEGAVRAGLADRVGSYSECLQAASEAATNVLSARGAASPSGKRMNAILQALGLSESASEADAVVAVVALRDGSTKLSSRVTELEAAVAASVPKTEADAACAALQSTIAEQTKKLGEAEGRAAAAEKQVKDLDKDRLVAKVDSFVGKKLTAANRDEWLTLAQENEARFDRMIAAQPDLGVTGPAVIESRGDETRSTDGADARVSRINALTSERMKKTGETRAAAMRSVMSEHPELCDDA